MMKKIQTLFMLCALALGIALIGPARSTEAASISRQVNVNDKKHTVTVYFRNFSKQDYTVYVKDETGTTVIPKFTHNLNTAKNNAVKIDISSLPQGQYMVFIEAADTSDRVVDCFYNYAQLSSVTYSGKTLYWKDLNEDTKGYKVKFYRNKSDYNKLNGHFAQATVAAGATKTTIPDSVSSGIYYVYITPFVQIDKGSYYSNYFGTPIVKTLYMIDAPTGVAVTPGYQKATISWNASAGATSYIVKNTRTKETRTVSGSSTSYTWTELKEGKKYNFCVYARFNTKSSPKSVSVSVTLPKATTGKVSNLQIFPSSGKIGLSWNAVSGADGYNIYYKKASSKKYTLWGTTKKTTMKKALSTNASYNFMVKPYSLIGGEKVDAAAQETVVTANPYVLLNEMVKVRTIGYYCKVNASTNLYNTVSSSTVARTISYGTRVEQLEAKNTKYNRTKILYNGQNYYIGSNKLTSVGANYTTKHYSQAVKEQFVNKYSSPTQYLVWISQYTQQVSVFQGSQGNWKMIRTFICATGKHTTRSARGNFKIRNKEKGWYYTNTYELYITHFYLRNSFHTRIHRYGGGYSDATIGRPASNGCIRLYDADAKYIWEKMPKDTTVISY